LGAFLWSPGQIHTGRVCTLVHLPFTSWIVIPWSVPVAFLEARPPLFGNICLRRSVPWVGRRVLGVSSAAASRQNEANQAGPLENVRTGKGSAPWCGRQPWRDPGLEKFHRFRSQSLFSNVPLQSNSRSRLRSSGSCAHLGLDCGAGSWLRALACRSSSNARSSGSACTVPLNPRVVVARKREL
jgi:hypothetical protein